MASFLKKWDISVTKAAIHTIFYHFSYFHKSFHFDAITLQIRFLVFTYELLNNYTWLCNYSCFTGLEEN